MATQPHPLSEPWTILGWTREDFERHRDDPALSKKEMTAGDLAAAARLWGYALRHDEKGTTAWFAHNGATHALSARHDPERGSQLRKALHRSVVQSMCILRGTDENAKSAIRQVAA